MPSLPSFTKGKSYPENKKINQSKLNDIFYNGYKYRRIYILVIATIFYYVINIYYNQCEVEEFLVSKIFFFN